MLVDQGEQSVFREGNGPASGPFVPPDWFFFWSENYGWFCSVLKQSSHRVLQNSAFEFLFQSWILSSSKQNISWRGEFVKMKIWNLQSLFVWSIILWRASALKMTEFLTHRPDKHLWSWNWCLIFTLLRFWWVNLLWHFWTPWGQFLRIKCCERHNSTCENVSRYIKRVPNAWLSFCAARHSHSHKNWMNE